MRHTRVKICGITQPEHARLAAACGVDAIGLVFYPLSPRAVDVEIARRIVAVLPPFVSVVGLFVQPDPATVHALLATVPLHILQFHGDESPVFCASFGRPYIKAVPMGAGADVHTYARDFHAATGLLLDSHGSTQSGGSGQPFDWSRIPSDCPKPLILAGGLHCDNVIAAIRRVQPAAVDVSSGVESRRGIKDPDKMRAFMEAVCIADGRALTRQ